MALAITQTGKEISTEKLLITAVTDAPDPPNQVTSVIMEVFVNNDTLLHELEHLPDFGTDNEFSFEINSIVKDYFASEFLPLSGVSQTVTENAIVFLKFYQVSPIFGKDLNSYDYTVVVKNMTQDTFEVEEFDLADYDCGDSGSSSSKLLTNAPNPVYVANNTSFFVSCLTTSYDALVPKQEWVIERYVNGVLSLATTEDVDVPTRDILPDVPAGKYDISNYRYDFDSSGADEVRIYIRDKASPFTVRSETRSFKLQGLCEKATTLTWLNEFGVWDSYTLAGNITRVGKYKDDTFKKVRPVDPVSTDVGDLVYNSSYNYQYDLFGDRMPETTVQWLSKMLINKRAAIQTEAILADPNSSEKEYGILYNWFVIDQGGTGNGTATGGIVNNTQTGWRVPSGGPPTLGTDLSNLQSFLGAGGAGQIKRTGFDYWDSPNTGATNSAKFNAVGSGTRSDSGLFSDKNTYCYIIGHGGSAVSVRTLWVQYNSSILNDSSVSGNAGVTIRLMRDAVGGENDGDVIKNAYTGNNGEIYDGVVIGSQVWLNRNLFETKLNNGSDIPNITDNTDWSNLTTGALCYYDNETIPAVFTPSISKFFPIVIETDESTLEDKFAPSTLFRVKFRLANRRKGLK